MAKHAKLSASGASRWMACPPSVNLEADFADKSSEFAEEGTFAHELGEILLMQALKQIKPAAFKKKFVALTKNPWYSAELEEYVNVYRDYVLETTNGLPKDAQVMLEQRLDFSDWVPEGFGTGDVVLVYDETIEVMDLKYGKGVAVSAEGNSQMRLYALGALSLFGDLYDIEKVKMTIIQPRLDSISTDELSVDELLEWAENEVKPKAEMAMNGEGEFTAGNHCRFCKAKEVCRARAEANLELAKFEFQAGDKLTLEEIGEILAKAEQLGAWVKDIKEYAQDQAVNHGVGIPGWKVVEGRSVRKYIDEEKVMNALQEAGYSEDRYIKREMRGITDLVRDIGKTAFDEMLGELIVKPPGKPTLAPASDKRPAINTVDSAIADFGEEPCQAEILHQESTALIDKAKETLNQ